MNELLPIALAVLGAGLIGAAGGLFLILRHLWKKHAMNETATRRFLITYATLWLACSLGIMLGILGLVAA